MKVGDTPERKGLQRARASWRQAKARCGDPNHHQFKNYGGRGIKFHPAWRDFDVFLSYMGPRPEGHTLDRIDPNKGYEPGNCGWATNAEQQRNKRDTIFVAIGGVKKPLVEWCELYDFSYVTAYKRWRSGRYDGSNLFQKPHVGVRPPGVQHHSQRLSCSDVIFIDQSKEGRVRGTAADLARKYKVSKEAIYAIWGGKTHRRYLDAQ